MINNFPKKLFEYVLLLGFLHWLGLIVGALAGFIYDLIYG